MSELTEVRTPVIIAAEINSIVERTKEFVLRNSIVIGQKLVEAKSLVAHGDWSSWLESNVSYSQSTANNLMQLYREYGSADSQAIGNLSYTKALSLIAIPGAEREQFIHENNVHDLSARELQQVIKEKQALEKKLKQAEDEADKVRRVKEDLEENSRAHAIEMARLEDELAKAKLLGDDASASKLQESLEQVNRDLANSKTKIKELERELKAKPIDVSAVVEKVPASVEAELVELRDKVSRLGDPSSVRFKVCFESLVKGFQDVLVALGEVKDEEMKEKYRGAVQGLINKMNKNL